MDKRLLDLLVCPVSKAPLRPLGVGELAILNRAISAGQVTTVSGAAVATPLAAGLITRDGHVIYPVVDEIPVMLREASIGTIQLEGFPR
jgi:uncharacterized protein YbaR (Trm112 family)